MDSQKKTGEAKKKMLQEQYDATFATLNDLRARKELATDKRLIATLNAQITSTERKLEDLRRQLS